MTEDNKSTIQNIDYKILADSISESLKDRIKEEVFIFGNYKDKETSHLHRDILVKIEGLEKKSDEAHKNQSVFNMKVEEHMLSVKPILERFIEDEIVKKGLLQKGKILVLIVLGASSLIGAWLVIKSFIKEIFIN